VRFQNVILRIHAASTDIIWLRELSVDTNYTITIHGDCHVKAGVARSGQYYGIGVLLTPIARQQLRYLMIAAHQCSNANRHLLFEHHARFITS
jgi:hypothetical protein